MSKPFCFSNFSKFFQKRYNNLLRYYICPNGKLNYKMNQYPLENLTWQEFETFLFKPQ